MTNDCQTLDTKSSYQVTTLEDRSAPRIQLQIPASLRQSGRPGFKVIIKDLSLSGFAAEALTAMGPGTRVWITMAGLSPLQSCVEWNDGFCVGCSFDNLLNNAVLDSILNHYSVTEKG